MAAIDPSLSQINEDATTEHLKEVARIERMYERKVQKAIKQQVKTENDPIQHLRSTKQNIDLKRGLEVKLASLNLQTDKALLELL